MAVTAESVVVELLARTDDFERKIGRAATSFDQDMRRVENSTARVANAQRNLGFQIQDISIGLATGQSPFTVLAQQAGQTASAVQDLGGTVGKVGAFIAGPYGSIIIAATAVLGNLALAHLNARDGADKQADAEKALKDATTALDQATGVANVSQREKIKLSREAADAALKETRNKLELAKAELVSEQTRSLSGRGRTGNFGLDQGEGRSVTAARAEVERIAKTIADAEARANQSARFGLADLAARAATSPIEAIRQQTEVKVDAVKKLNLDQAELTRRLTALYKEEEQAIKRVAEAAQTGGGGGGTVRIGRAAPATPAPETTLDQLRRIASETPAASARQLLGDTDFGVKEVVLDFEKLRDTVGDVSKIKFIDAEALATGQRFAENLTQTLGQAVIFSGNIGDALVNSLKAAAAEAIGSGLLNILTGGRAGRSFGSTLAGIGSIFGFAGGGPVNAGQVIKINETGQELFRPSVPGRIIPAGQANMMGGGGGGGASIVQNLNINFAGNAATREEAATFARIAYEQSLRAFREAGAFGVPSV